MKRSFFIVVLGVLTTFFWVSCTVTSSEDNVAETFSEIRKPNHVHCSCTGALGGSASATCVDGSSCSCTTGLFSCNCDCDSSHAADSSHSHPNSPVNEDPIDEGKWNITIEYLSGIDDDIAAELVEQLISLQELYYEDYEAFLSMYSAADELYMELPIEIRNELLNLLN